MILPGDEKNTLPEIVFDEMKGTVSIKGRSISPEVNVYFEEFISYFKDCIQKQPMNLKVDIDMEYYNSSTSRILVDFFKSAKIVEEKNFNVDISWYIEKDDEDMIERAHDYESLVGLKFNVIEK